MFGSQALLSTKLLWHMHHAYVVTLSLYRIISSDLHRWNFHTQCY